MKELLEDPLVFGPTDPHSESGAQLSYDNIWYVYPWG